MIKSQEESNILLSADCTKWKKKYEMAMDELKDAYNFIGNMKEECNDVENEVKNLYESKTLYTTIYKIAEKHKKI